MTVGDIEIGQRIENRTDLCHAIRIVDFPDGMANPVIGSHVGNWCGCCGQREKVLGYGASTKGNVLLQFCGFSSADIPAIAEVNTEKFGRVTPGTHIPIVSESDALAMQPDYFLVLPWHFKDSILRREISYLFSKGTCSRV